MYFNAFQRMDCKKLYRKKIICRCTILDTPTSLLAPTRIVTRTGITKINFDLITSLDDEHFSFCACYLRGSILLRRMGKCQDKNDDVEVTVVAVLYVVAFLL